MFDEMTKQIEKIGIVPVIVINDASKAGKLAKAVYDGGITAIEVTFRTAAAEEAIKVAVKECPEMLVGAGTVINVEQAKRAVAAGAKFIVSPGFGDDVVDWCIANNIPVVPGVCTPSEVMRAVNKGLSTLKLFPAELSGGVAMVKNLCGPFPQVKFMTTGGISTKNLAEYAQCKFVAAVGGSWMAKADLIEAENWAEITKLSKEATEAFAAAKKA